MAISVDSPEDSENLRRSQGYTFPILSDAQEDVIRRWDLVHLHGRHDGADISRPAEFLIDPSGKVRWYRRFRGPRPTRRGARSV